MLTVILGIFSGCLPTVQTAANSRLRRRTGSPFSSAFISFVIGVCFLLLLLLCSGQFSGFTLSVTAGQPWWIWLGGALAWCISQETSC